MAMERVLTTTDMVRHVFCNIKDADPLVAARTLSRWCAVNRFIRNACTADDKAVWLALMNSAFKKWLAWDVGHLARDIKYDGQHPRIYLAFMIKTAMDTKWVSERDSLTANAYHCFYHSSKDEHLEEERQAKEAAGWGPDPQPLSHHQWAEREWRGMAQWKLTLFEAIVRVEQAARARARLEAMKARMEARREWMNAFQARQLAPKPPHYAPLITPPPTSP